jgi:hypothetical protein
MRINEGRVMKQWISVIGALAFAGVVEAQEPPVPGMGQGSGVSGCLDRLAEKFGDRMRIPGTGMDRPDEIGSASSIFGMGGDTAAMAMLKMEVASAARGCMAGLTPETADKKDLRSLLTLYTLSEQYDQAYATVKRLASLKSKPRDKAVELSDGIRLLAQPSTKLAERLMADLDRLGTGAAAEWRMIGHGVLMDTYIASAANVNRDKHFEQALAASKQVKQRDSKIAWELGNIYVNYATALLNAGDTAKSRAIIKRGLADLANEEVASRDLKLLDESTRDKQ